MAEGGQLKIWLSADLLNRKRTAWLGPRKTGFILLLAGVVMLLAGGVPVVEVLAQHSVHFFKSSESVPPGEPAVKALLTGVPQDLPPAVYTATLLVFGFGLSLLGACLFFGGRQLLFDRKQGLVTVRSLAVITLKTAQFRLRDFDRISVKPGVARGPFSPAPYPVQLEGPEGNRLLIQEAFDAERARARAQELSAFLELRVEDLCPVDAAVAGEACGA